MIRRTAALLLFSAVLSSRAFAQIDSALLSKVSFNLSNAGGKSLAMGGAFTAIADDATAALANPAGLGLLSSVELGLSAKRFDETIGLVTATSTAAGNLVAPYPSPRSINSDITSVTGDLEYAGVVVPVSRRLVAAVTFAENLRFEGNPGPDGYQYVEFRDNRSGGVTRRDFLNEYREFGSVSLRNRLVGLTLGYRVTDRIRLGGGLTLNRTTFDLEGDAGGPHRIVSVTYPSLVSQVTTTTLMGVQGFGGTKAGFVVGVHADLVEGGALTVGAVYRSGAKTEGTFVLGGQIPAALVGQESRPFSFSVPRDAAFGLAWHPFPGLTVAAEGQWIAYSQIFDVALPVVTYAGLVNTGFPVDGILVNLKRPKDAALPRIGFEYVATSGDVRTAFRVGYHREPAHGVRADLVARDGSGNPYDIVDPPYSQGVRTVFDGGRGDDRFSGGLGLTLKRSLSLDIAFDIGRASRQLAASLFYRF
jgi:long-chain fatty acid transport protein